MFFFFFHTAYLQLQLVRILIAIGAGRVLSNKIYAHVFSLTISMFTHLMDPPI
jgi:hypothetical protein